MTVLLPDQRNHYYLIEAARVGIHKPILAALYAVQTQPTLTDGETGLGIMPTNQLELDQVNTFPAQVQYAANTIRSLTDSLIKQEWTSGDIWNGAAGRYGDRFLETLAQGYTPDPSDISSAQLESSNYEALRAAYLEDLEIDHNDSQLPANLADLDSALLAFAERVAPNYTRLEHQRRALMEAIRIWRQLSGTQAIYNALKVPVPELVPDETELDKALVEFIQSATGHYAGFPNQREALIRLVQLWQAMNSREEAIAWLLSHDSFSNETNLGIVDPALMAFVQKLPTHYKGRGDQRLALTEGYRCWFGLDSRTTAIQQLGVNPDLLLQQADDRDALVARARTLDRALLEFVNTIPKRFDRSESQREALIRMVQLWEHHEGRIPTIQSLFEDLRRLERAEAASPDMMPAPRPVPLPPRPARWNARNIQLDASILPNGNFTWAEATRGGSHMPPNQETVEAIVRIAELAQQARDRIGRPFVITTWYRPTPASHRVGGATRSRHSIGDAIDFYCSGLTGDQLYWALDPWWPGGLGRYSQYSALVHLDARGYKARWTQ
jgi:hypothetical protein